MQATVSLPNSLAVTTPLGVGLATVMREPSPAGQQRLLHAAYDAGFRHFDVAPSYGLGAAERVLGAFLRTKPRGVTVGTKVGIMGRGDAGVMQLLQRPARALLRRFPGLRGGATHAVGAVARTSTDFSVATLTRSLENSLDALGCESLDILLLHDVRPTDLTDGSVIEWMLRQRERGLLRSIGVATSVESAAAIVNAHARVFDVVQVPSHVLTPASEILGPVSVPLRITHSALAVVLAKVQSRIRDDVGWGRSLSARVGTDAAAPGELARLLLALAHWENPNGIVLLGSSRIDHLRTAPQALNAFDESALATAAQFLRATLSA